MLHKGVGYRTPRTQAIKMGTESKGFAGELPYDAQAGVPASMTGGRYYDNAADEAKMQPGQNKPSVHKDIPFVLK